MNLNCSFVCSFQEVRSFFALCDTLDLVVTDTQFLMLSRRSGMHMMWPFDASIRHSNDEDKDVLHGVTISSELLLKLPSMKKVTDVVRVTMYTDLVEIQVNDYKISSPSQLFDRRNANAVINSLTQPHAVNLYELFWYCIHFMQKQMQSLCPPVRQ